VGRGGGEQRVVGVGEGGVEVVEGIHGGGRREAVVGWEWIWTRTRGRARAVRSGRDAMQVKRVGFGLRGCERKRKSVGFQRGNGLLSYCFPPEIWILCAASLCCPLPEPEAQHNLLSLLPL